jgi:hypothetical protein
MGSQPLMAFVIGAPHRRLLERAVHAFELTICRGNAPPARCRTRQTPRMVRLGETMIDIVLSARQCVGVWAVRRCSAAAVNCRERAVRSLLSNTGSKQASSWVYTSEAVENIRTRQRRCSMGTLLAEAIRLLTLIVALHCPLRTWCHQPRCSAQRGQAFAPQRPGLLSCQSVWPAEVPRLLMSTMSWSGASAHSRQRWLGLSEQDLDVG